MVGDNPSFKVKILLNSYALDGNEGFDDFDEEQFKVEELTTRLVETGE